MEDQKDQKRCIVCTMPLVTKDDYPEGADMESTNHCTHCGTKDELHPYESLVSGMTQFIVQSQGMVEDEAAKVAKQIIDNSEAVKMGVLEIEEE